MIPFKIRKLTLGFTLPEVLLSIFLIGSLGASLLDLQSISLFNIERFSQRLMRILLINNFIVDQQQLRFEKKEPLKEKAIPESQTTLRYTVKKPAKNSSLAPLKYLTIDYIEAQWFDGSQKKSEYMVRLHYEPPRSKKETPSS